MKTTVSQVIKEWVRIWLNQVGWERNPFARSDSLTSPVRRAGDERETLGQHFRWTVIRIGANGIEGYEKLLDDESHSVLFAGAGEGKSACRFMVANDAQKYNILVVEYLKFDPHPLSAEEHAREIQLRISQALGEGQRTFGAPGPALVDISAAKERGFKVIFVLIDNVTEDFDRGATTDEIEQVITNLFDHRFFEIPGLYFKFFLPDSLAERLSIYLVIAGRKHPIDLLHVRWTEEALRQLLREKIVSVSRKGEDSFLSLSDDGRGQPFDVDKELINAALSRPGAPRNLNILACNLIYAHARNEPDPEKFRLTKRDLKDAITYSRLQTEGECRPQTFDSSDVDEDQQHLRELIAEKRRRLRVLEYQAAKFGDYTPPHIEIEIEDLRLEIAELEAQLNSQGFR